MQNQSSSNEMLPFDPSDAWTRFGHAKVIKKWAGELLAALAAGAKADWELTGRAIFIQHDKPDECFELVQLAASVAGISALRLNPADIKEPAQGLIAEDQLRPVIVYLDEGDWSAKARPSGSDDATRRALQSTVKDLLGKFDPVAPVILVTSGDDYSDLSASLRQVGLFDRCLEVVALTVEERGFRFIHLLGSPVCSADLLAHPGRLGQLLDCETEGPEDFGAFAVSLKRLAHREARTLDYLDVVRACLHGAGEKDVRKTFTHENLYRTAVHEAGHAAIAILNSNGNDVPDYSAIGLSGDFTGIVAPSYALLIEKDFDLVTVRHYVRVLLAGRAAEHVALGWDKISTGGAHSDLRRAKRWATDLFAYSGVSMHADDDNLTGDNLCVAGKIPSDSEHAHVEPLVRRFLHEQYNVVLAMLRNSRGLLDAITDKLIEQSVMSQQDMKDVIKTLSLQGKVNCLPTGELNFDHDRLAA